MVTIQFAEWILHTSTNAHMDYSFQLMLIMGHFKINNA